MLIPPLASLPPLREVIAQHDLMAKKSLGQHFLCDLNLTRRIAAAAGDLSGESGTPESGVRLLVTRGRGDRLGGRDVARRQGIGLREDVYVRALCREVVEIRQRRHARIGAGAGPY